jgi:ferredoxin/flavodoxin---NADP+ reductase
MPVAMNAVLVKRILLAPDLIIMRIALEGRSIQDFKPGQYCAIGVLASSPRCEGAKPEKENLKPDKLISRAYSIASPPSQKKYLEIYVTVVPEGGLTPRLFHLKEGDKLWVAPKITGTFVMDSVPPEAHLVLISTGTGLAPYMSMLGHAGVIRPNRRIAVLHGVRHSWELGYREELEVLVKEHSNITYFPMVSRPKFEKIPWTGLTGHVQKIWEDALIEKAWGFKPKSSDTHFFLCGNPAMIDDMVKILTKDGFTEHSSRTPGAVHLERYW